MHAQLRDLTQGPLAKQILLFSLPLIASNLLQVLFNMSDVAVVGRFAGSVALGAVGSTTTLVTLFTGFIIGMSNGVNVLTALHFGAKSRRELSDTIHSAILICLGTGLILMVVGVGFARPILELLNTKEELTARPCICGFTFWACRPWDFTTSAMRCSALWVIPGGRCGICLWPVW